MKKALCLAVIVLTSLFIRLTAQGMKAFSASEFGCPYRLEVGYNKTTHLVFPASILSIDRGSAAILAQKASGVDNILRVKADQKGFAETSLGVITGEGKLYCFLVTYSDNPASLRINLESASGDRSSEWLKQKPSSFISEALLATDAKRVLLAKKNLHGLRDKAAKVSMVVEGIYVREGVLFIRLGLQNGSTINYDIEGLRLYTKEKPQGKRTAVQENEIVPLWIEGERATIKANSKENVVLALPKLTMAKGKYLVVELREEGGDRHLLLKLKGKHLLNAQPLD